MAQQVPVHSNDGEKAIKNLKRKLQRELVFRSMKNSRHHEPASVKRVRKQEESNRRRRKNNKIRQMED